MVDRETEKLTHDDWPEPGQYTKSVRTEFAAFVALLILVLMSITGYLTTNEYVSSVTRNVMAKNLAQARAYAHSAAKPLLAEAGADRLLLGELCKQLSQDNSDVFWVGITGRDSVYVAHTDFKNVVSGIVASVSEAPPSNYPTRSGETLSQTHDSMFVWINITERDIVVGHMIVAASTTQISEARSAAISIIITVTITMILIGALMSWWLVRRKLDPLTQITAHLQQFDPTKLELEIPIKSNDEFGYLSDTLSVMGSKLQTAQALAIEKERINRELEIAREIQSKILPADYPCQDSYQFVGHYRSAKEVGGDYYDFVQFKDGRIGLIVADVSGKSLPGMLVMLLTRDIVKRVSAKELSPAAFLSEVNHELRPQMKRGMFVTMFYGILDPKQGSLIFASAGHNPLAIADKSSSECKLYKTKGYPLGMMPDEAFAKRIEEDTIQLNDGDWIIQYSDGINEAQSADGEEFGMDRMKEQFTKCSALPPEIFVETFMLAHDSFVGENDQFDDITLLALLWTKSKRAIPNDEMTMESIDVQ